MPTAAGSHYHSRQREEQSQPSQHKHGLHPRRSCSRCLCRRSSGGAGYPSNATADADNARNNSSPANTSTAFTLAGNAAAVFAAAGASGGAGTQATPQTTRLRLPETRGNRSRWRAQSKHQRDKPSGLPLPLSRSAAALSTLESASQRGQASRTQTVRSEGKALGSWRLRHVLRLRRAINKTETAGIPAT